MCCPTRKRTRHKQIIIPISASHIPISVFRPPLLILLSAGRHHEAVTRLIAHVVREAREKDVSVCVCGELGADVTATAELLRMGVDSLSVAPNSLLAVKKAVRECE